MNSAIDFNVEVRAAELTDVPELARLFTELGYSIDADLLAQRFVTYGEAGELVLVAEQRKRDTVERRLVGLATLHATPVLHRSGPVGRITALVVDTTARGKGIGRTLVAEAERWAATKGCVLIEVTSNKRRQDAHAFYQRLGYECTSARFAKSLDPR